MSRRDCSSGQARKGAGAIPQQGIRGFAEAKLCSRPVPSSHTGKGAEAKLLAGVCCGWLLQNPQEQRALAESGDRLSEGGKGCLRF